MQRISFVADCSQEGIAAVSYFGRFWYNTSSLHSNSIQVSAAIFFGRGGAKIFFDVYIF